MKKMLILAASIALACTANAQLFKKKNKETATTTTTAVAVTPAAKIDLSQRPADHFMIQYGYDALMNRPDSVNTKGFSRHFNLYVMLDKPFSTNKHFSVAYGLGIGSSNIFFENTYVNLKAPTSQLPFTNVANQNHFKKFKLTTIYAEAPVELRYFTKPEDPNRSWKFAVGAKVGMLLTAYTKGKNLVDKNGSSLYGLGYIEKERSHRFINTYKLALTARVAYGNFGLHAGYNIMPLVKQGLGAPVNTASVGLCISGL